MNYATAKAQAEVFRALAHPVRLLMLEALARGERYGTDLRKLARLNQSNMSRHVAQLKRAGLVSDRRAGIRVVYTLAEPRILETLERASGVALAEARRRLAHAGKQTALA
jgi:ArsR family transcriptional regulator